MTERGVIVGGLAAFVALCAVAVWLHAPEHAARGTVSAVPAAPLAAPIAGVAPATPSPVNSPSIATAKPTPAAIAPTSSPSPATVQSTPMAAATALARPTSTPSPTPTATPSLAAANPSLAKKVEQDIAKQLASKVIEFESVSDKLTDNGKAVLNSLVPLLAQDPTSRFEIGGHTDSWGEKEFNQALSERRARTVRAYLVSKGLDGQRFTARGYGDSKPIANNQTTAGSRKNRRIEFTAQ